MPPAARLEMLGLEYWEELKPGDESGDDMGTLRSSGSSLLSLSLSLWLMPRWAGGREGGRGNWFWLCMARLLSSLGRSLRLGAVGDALAASSDGDTFTPALESSLLASSGSNGAGMGTTGRSLVLIPLCCLDMCEWRLFLDLATVPHNTHLTTTHQ